MSVCVLHNTSPCNVFVSPVFTCCTLWFLQSLAAFVSLDSFAAPTRVQANFFWRHCMAFQALLLLVSVCGQLQLH